MFKEPEKGRKDINVERAEEALATGATTIAVACPFCMTMMSDGVKHFEKESEVQVLDLAEILIKDMENGEWRMKNEEWRMENGEWRMENGE